MPVSNITIEICEDNKPERLPILALLALAMTGFIGILTETLPAGLLPGISHDLDISASLSGQMVTAYAFGSLIAAIPLTIATQHWRRRTVLIATILGFFIFNTVTAISSDFIVTIFPRFMVGAAAGLSCSLIAGYARRMVAPHQQGRALAIAMTGTPVALSLGVPLGTWMGNMTGWRTMFSLISVLSILLIVWVWAKVPDYPGQPVQHRLRLKTVFMMPGVCPVMGVIITWMLAHNILYTYIAPFVSASGLSGSIDNVLFIFGIAAIAGIYIISRVIEKYLRGAVLASLFVLPLLLYF